MALRRLFCCIFLLHFLYHHVSAVASARYFLPLAKDERLTQFYTSFLIGTPPIRVYMVVDIGLPFSWFACNTVGYKYNHSSSTGNFLSPLIDDSFSVYSSPSSTVKPPLPKFPFTCTDEEPLKGLSRYTKGVVTFARTPRAIHAHVSSSLKVSRKFALCAPSSSASGINGAVYFGGGPYIIPPSRVDMSKFLVTTALVANPHSTCPYYNDGGGSVEYFINLRSIKIDGTSLRFNTSLLSFDSYGKGGTKISTMDQYSALHPQIYKPFLDLFVSKVTTLQLVKVAPVEPFGACFNSRSIRYNAKTGKGVPVIDLVMNEKSGKNARWRIYGSNSMVRVSRDVECLGFVDGGKWGSIASIAIGAKQLEDNLVEFDLEANKVGFTSLLPVGISCSQFKGF